MLAMLPQRYFLLFSKLTLVIMPSSICSLCCTLFLCLFFPQHSFVICEWRIYQEKLNSADGFIYNLSRMVQKCVENKSLLYVCVRYCAGAWVRAHTKNCLLKKFCVIIIYQYDDDRRPTVEFLCVRVSQNSESELCVAGITRTKYVFINMIYGVLHAV